ncbi:hypothetical protein [Clostridium butyricum]|jgi:hypothetical protein|uniref:Uncharacterized protein n=1 Tax=Clostridium butyricum TaxID=1492 RepID=A0A512TPQ1_CLOBU|nr:hypothetical protein [Clostridium butyricum]MBZ5748072.1 hypothetical protein [Clostridium butyricum]MDI9209213.1 hypothetical protein [Clostridium butyricum]MDU6037819.1 hypothetical protein [Clostridium butyricum]NOW21779.1 hypothetical protein [Clostridium butyricum]BBK76902.1 hypothetical protein Cbu04g_19100 [Clostridium butyricum]
MLEFTSPVPMEKLKEKIEEGWFDEEVLIHFVNALKGPDKEKLLNGEIKPYDLFELDIMIRDRGWMQVYINSQEYADMDSETLNVVKKRIDRLFEQAKEECRVDIDGTEEVAPEVPVQEQSILSICSKCKELNIAFEIMHTLQWTGVDNYLSALLFDKDTKTILIDEESLMRAISIANPKQPIRKLKLISNEEYRELRSK